MNYIYRKIRLDDIRLYSENPRFESASSEEEIIQKLILDQGGKLLNLAEHIIDNGFNPSDIPIVFKKGKKFIVKEGNRRAGALKLVDNPNLIYTDNLLRNKFSVLRSQKGHLIPSHVYCVIFNKPADADEWIRLKHAVKTEGVGTEKWNSQQANRFAKGDIRELPIELQAFEILKNNRETSQSIKNLIPTIKATNLRRLLTDPYVRNKIGLSVIDGQLILLQPQKSALKNLESLISIISSDSFVVDKIYYNRDRRRFINSIKLARIKIKTSIPLPSKKNTRAVLYKYNSLIDPRDKTPSSVGDKVKSIYNELQIVSLDVTPHASAFLLRALIEIAVKRYLKRQGIKSDNSDVIYVKSSSGKTKKIDSLKGKINYIADTFITDSDLKSHVQLLNKKFFTTSLNQFVHNEFYQATRSELMDFWRNAHKFFDFLITK